MKKKNTLWLAALTLLATVSQITTSNAQTDNGAACGCPPTTSRPTVNLSDRATYVGLPNDYRLNNTVTVLSCDTTWILDHKIYVDSGQVIIVQPGTVVKATFTAVLTDATALIVQVGGRIYAQGSETCPIIFTSTSDDLTGSYGITNRGRWGGLVLLGKATNNLTLAANGPAGAGKLAVSDGVGYTEGYNASNSRNNFGRKYGTFDDNDNSGALSYISIRHGGAVLNSNGNELNSLTLASVGRGTKIDHIEIVAGNDDAIEFFGGNVNIKYAASLWGADDMFDYDLGWTGKAQFLFGLNNSDTLQNTSADNGFEADADDNKSNNLPRSHPVIYNATFISNGDNQLTGDNSALAGINAKELTEGEIYSSVFANYRRGFNMTRAFVAPRTGEVYANWTAGSLIVSCNTFVGCTDSITLDRATTAVTAGDRTKFRTDGNTAPSSLAGFTPTYAMNGTTNDVTTPFDATPNPQIATTCAPPNDGFFTPTNYRGAFGGSTNWLANWSFLSFLDKSTTLGPLVSGAALQGCSTDVNNDGTTNNGDFLDLLGKFNQTCE